MLKPNADTLREVVVRYRRRRIAAPISGPDGAARWFQRVAPDNSREHLLALYLDGNHSPIAWRLVATGSATECIVHPREILQPAILLGAVALIVGHNHPSGNLAPSPEDREIAKRLREACELLGLRLLDSLVFTSDGRWQSVTP